MLSPTQSKKGTKSLPTTSMETANDGMVKLAILGLLLMIITGISYIISKKYRKIRNK